MINREAHISPNSPNDHDHSSLIQRLVLILEWIKGGNQPNPNTFLPRSAAALLPPSVLLLAFPALHCWSTIDLVASSCRPAATSFLSHLSPAADSPPRERRFLSLFALFFSCGSCEILIWSSCPDWELVGTLGDGGSSSCPAGRPPLPSCVPRIGGGRASRQVRSGGPLFGFVTRNRERWFSGSNHASRCDCAVGLLRFPSPRWGGSETCRFLLLDACVLKVMQKNGSSLLVYI
jgi:hypothetical protein